MENNTKFLLIAVLIIIASIIAFFYVIKIGIILLCAAVAFIAGYYMGKRS